MTGRYLKKALIRDWTVPIGQSAPMHLICLCGSDIDVPDPFTDAIITCPTCRQTFDSFGWTLEQGAAHCPTTTS